METKFRIFRVISCLLTFIILCQSCTIYRSASISVDEAVESQNKVRVKTESNRNYNFKRIERDEAGIYGIAFKRSKIARQLSNDVLPGDLPDNLVKIKLRENSIEEINPRNKTLSILVPALTVATGVLIFALTYEVNVSPFGD